MQTTSFLLVIFLLCNIITIYKWIKIHSPDKLNGGKIHALRKPLRIYYEDDATCWTTLRWTSGHLRELHLCNPARIAAALGARAVDARNADAQGALPPRSNKSAAGVSPRRAGCRLSICDVRQDAGQFGHGDAVICHRHALRLRALQCASAPSGG